MLFNSLSFICLFLPVAYLVFWRLPGRHKRYVWLTLTGYAFYAFWNYKFCALMLLSTLVSYLAGLGLLRYQEPRRRRLCVLLPVTLDLALLGFFKYANFFLGTVNGLSDWLGAPAGWSPLDIVLPVGISFYTFHTITYMVDAYRGVITPTRSFFQFAAYVSLFPQLVAGPIVRFRQIHEDLEAIDRAERTADLDSGWSFFVIGLAKKVLLADTIGAVITPALAEPAGLSTLGAWLCVIGFSYQIYYDFSGYSDMAVGLGLMFGLRLPQNFDSPYRALDPADLWRRWHISMSSFFRDYVYVPLGGSRVPRLTHYRNLIVTMLLAGLWHGANWTFVVWGLYNGVCLVLTHLAGPAWSRLPAFCRRGGTFLLWVVGMAVFRSESLAVAGSLLGVMFSWHAGTSPVGTPVLLAATAVAAAFAHLGPNTFELHHRWSPAYVACLTVLCGLCLFVLYGTSSAPFLYFQF